MKEFIDKLIRRFEEEPEPSISMGKDYLISGNAIPKERVVEIVNQLAEEYKGGWIPCSERLPEVSNWYLITVSEPHETFILYFDTYDNDWTDFNCITIKNVIAWMPLPAPYTEGE